MLRNFSISPRLRSESPTPTMNPKVSPSSDRDHEFTTLNPNNIFIGKEPMNFEKWSRLAFSLGIRAAEDTTLTSEAKRFARKARQRRKDTGVHLGDLLESLLVSIATTHAKLDHRVESTFFRDAIPQQIPEDKVARCGRQLPTPKPTITFGYWRNAFRQRYINLQQGIIAGDNGEPCDLAQVSQLIPDTYWPFLVVEVQPRENTGTMVAAKHACAGSGATCNNAVLILSNAAQPPSEYSTSPSLQWDNLRLAQTFSLAVEGLEACLSSHNSPGVSCHTMAEIRRYKLDDEEDVQALCSRIESIMVWAEESRFTTILELLDRFDRRVHSGVPSKTPMKADFPEDVWNERYGDDTAPGQRNRSRSPFWDRFPVFSRFLKS